MLRALPIVLLFSLAACGSATAPDARNGHDGFAGDALRRYTTYSDQGNPWSLQPGALRGDGFGLHAVLVRNGAALRDGWVEVLADSVDDGGLVLRFADNEHYYLLAVRDDQAPAPRGQDNLQLYRRSGPGQAGFTSLWRRNVAWPRGTQREVRFEAAGDSLRVYLDGERMGAVADTARLTGSRLGLRHYGDSPDWTTRYRRLRWRVER